MNNESDRSFLAATASNQKAHMAHGSWQITNIYLLGEYGINGQSNQRIVITLDGTKNCKKLRLQMLDTAPRESTVEFGDPNSKGLSLSHEQPIDFFLQNIPYHAPSCRQDRL
jgi:hypothetical protein